MLTLGISKSSKPKHYYCCNSGFTLIELLVSLSIIALVALAITPLIGASLDKMRVKSSVHDIVNQFKIARQEAINRSIETTITFDLENNSYNITHTKSLSFPKETSIVLKTASNEQIDRKKGNIRFFQDGSSTGGNLIVKFRNMSYQINVNWLNGHVSLETPS